MSVLEVLAPGLFTTVQDLGRPGLGHLGVALGGAMDRDSLRLANLAVGNSSGAAALECTLVGPELLAQGDLVLAVAGADLGFRADGECLPLFRAVSIPGGTRLKFTGGTTGCRTYLAVAGGSGFQRFWAVAPRI